MLAWLVPISFYWVLVAVYLGGTASSPVGGTPLRQVLGLVVSFVVFVLVWWVLRLGLASLGDSALWSVVLPIALTMLALPLIVRVGFGVLGVKIAKVGIAH